MCSKSSRSTTKSSGACSHPRERANPEEQGWSPMTTECSLILIAEKDTDFAFRFLCFSQGWVDPIEESLWTGSAGTVCAFDCSTVTIISSSERHSPMRGKSDQSNEILAEEAAVDCSNLCCAIEALVIEALGGNKNGKKIHCLRSLCVCLTPWKLKYRK
eukprot:15367142-Ditylum_brightwellii.AAC.1